MSRALAFCAAVILSIITVSSACIATTAAPLSFRLTARDASNVGLSLSRNGRHGGNMTSTFAPSDLPGLDIAALGQPGRRPIRFALVREAGRVDCTGSGGSAAASGECRFAPDVAFASLLKSRGIGRPTDEQSYELTVVGATRKLIDALAAYHYARPNVEKLVELAAVGVNRRFVADLAARGYQPASLDDLTQFAALDVSPSYIDALARSGYRKLSADEITELKALDVDPAFAAAGYRNLSVDDLQQIAALEITPRFIQGFARIGYANLPVDTLVQLKALDVTPEFVLNLERRGLARPSAEKLAELKAIGFDEQK